VTLDKSNWLAERFEENRTHLRAVAYRMLGSLSETDDAVARTVPLLRRCSGALQSSRVDQAVELAAQRELLKSPRPPSLHNDNWIGPAPTTSPSFFSEFVSP
jgi:hypothetical protein